MRIPNDCEVSRRRSIHVRLLTILVLLTGCGPRFSCPQLHAPQTGAYTRMPNWSNGLSPGVFYYPYYDARIAIDPGCSTVCVEKDGEGIVTSIAGTIDATIEPDCIGPACKLVLANLSASTDDFIFGDQVISQMKISQGEWTGAARWEDDNTLLIPPEGLSFWIGYNRNDVKWGNAVTSEGALWGNLDRDYDNFVLAGQLEKKGYFVDNVQFGLCGHPIARPPVAVLTPSGPFMSDSSGFAHVSFSSAQSYDPDNDIDVQRTMWQMDMLTVASGVDTFAADLSRGTHTISVSVVDSRGAYRTATETVNVE